MIAGARNCGTTHKRKAAEAQLGQSLEAGQAVAAAAIKKRLTVEPSVAAGVAPPGGTAAAAGLGTAEEGGTGPSQPAAGMAGAPDEDDPEVSQPAAAPAHAGEPPGALGTSGAGGRLFVADAMATPIQALGSGAALISTLAAAGPVVNPAPPLRNMGTQGQQRPGAQQHQPRDVRGWRWRQQPSLSRQPLLVVPLLLLPWAPLRREDQGHPSLLQAWRVPLMRVTHRCLSLLLPQPMLRHHHHDIASITFVNVNAITTFANTSASAIINIAIIANEVQLSL
ncbi:hypothetical protein HaLaN_00378 [Haematococcus lacustris]|uniref:Uncharacterized protein n=1 Tax=Haematococcus lacustris TaxID=44745 RepID=A0A699Y6R8_HAELA|nr:hypothetical protein HaLaN_00378 [Haematococcus lacustris]